MCQEGQRYNVADDYKHHAEAIDIDHASRTQIITDGDWHEREMSDGEILSDAIAVHVGIESRCTPCQEDNLQQASGNRAIEDDGQCRHKDGIEQESYSPWKHFTEGRALNAKDRNMMMITQ